MQNAAIEMHWLMVNHVSRLKKAEKPKMLVWRTEFGRGVFFGGKLNKPCGYWFCQKWLLIISKRPKKSSEWCYFILTPPTDHGTILRRSPHRNNDVFCIYSKSILDVWAHNASNWCFFWRKEVWGKEKMWKSQTHRCMSLNPRGSVSPTTPPQTGVLCTERNSCSLLGRAGHQVAFAIASRVVGWKVNFWSFYLL